VLWRIRVAFADSSYLDQALAVYLTHCELASDEHSQTYDATRRKISQRSGVSIRRVSEINSRFKDLKVLDWNQNKIEGTNEQAACTFTLFGLRTTSTTPCKPSTRSCKKPKQQICTVVEQSTPKNLNTINLVNGGLTKLTANLASMKRIAREIAADKHGWTWDNCKVNAADILPASLQTVLESHAVGLAENVIHECWKEAAVTTHKATVDGLANEPSGYVIACFKEQLTKGKK
jgi:hypothetical protein